MPVKTLLCTVLISFSLYSAADEAYISIIIDDMGYRNRDDARALKLPGKITYAIMPFSPNAKKINQQLENQDKNVLLHMPMQAVSQNDNRFLGPGALTLDMDKSTFTKTIHNAIKSMPNAVGMNNHMGSLLSQHSKQMQWLMESLHSHRLFYLDSVTVRQGKARSAARYYHVPYLRRDVFLDNQSNVDYISSQFQLLIKTAKENGSAIAIGHPRPNTLMVLERELKKLDPYVKLITLNTLLNQRKSFKLVNNKL